MTPEEIQGLVEINKHLKKVHNAYREWLSAAWEENIKWANECAYYKKFYDSVVKQAREEFEKLYDK